ncbi:unnamed protein product [Notodromas monacha]|uniref:Uncharacterized protein n=1 Tax=Notodromas monacha TaxID=399045 RepID=A0A7R9BQV7_9CRUS|nr:unnamed protein product [Notodromas monacha]CAG0918649.1 unnamed protein product [Notodromas monacha]
MYQDVDEVLGVWAMVNYGIFPQRGCPGDREFPENLHAIMATNGSYLEVQKIPEPCDMEGDEAPVTCFNRRSVTATHPAGDEGVSDQISFDKNKRFMRLYSEATMPRYRKSPQSVRCSWLSAWDVAQRMKAIPHTREAGPSSPSSETRKKVASGSRLPHDEQFPDVKWIISPDGEADSKSFRFTPSGPSIEVWTDVIIPRFPGQIGIGVYALVSWDGPISPNIEIR